MLSILRGEFRKVYTSKSLIIFIAILIALSAFYAVFNWFTYWIVYQLAYDGAEVVIELPFKQLMLGSMNGTMSYSFILLAVFLAIWNLRDYSSGSIKNMIAKGCSRTNIYFAKYIVSITTTVVYFLVHTSIYVGVSAFLIKFNEGFSLEIFELYMLEILIVIALGTVYFGIIMLTHKIAPAIILNVFLGQVWSATLVIIDSFVENDKMNFLTLHLESVLGMLSGEQSISYLLLSSMTNVSEINATFILHMIIVCVIYIALFLMLGFVSTRKREY